MLTNVHDRKHDFLSYIIDNIPHRIFWKDKNLVFRGCNKKFAQQFGYESAEDIIGKTDNDFDWLPKLRDKYVSDDMEIISKGSSKLDYEEEQKQPDGSIWTVLVSKVPIYDDDNEVVGILGIYTDITDRKRAETLQKEKEFAEKTARFMEGIAGSIAHELRTPLAIVNLQMDLLSGSIDSKKETAEEKADFVKETIKIVKDTIRSASYIITNILVKIRSLAVGEIPRNNFISLSIIEDVGHLLELYPFQGDEKSFVHFKSDGSFRYVGDGDLTKHVLFNLIKNALRAIQEAKHGEITVSFASDADNNKLIFRDTAKGIPKKMLSKIFKQFETKEQSGKGTGLGLPFCKMVMHSYGGDIKVNSKEGEFTEFVLTFPKLFK